MAEPKKPVAFEDALKRLETIVTQLESGDQSLDQSLRLFEEGIKLSRFCNDKLNEAEKKISLLVKNPNGTLEEKDIQSKEEEPKPESEDNQLPF